MPGSTELLILGVIVLLLFGSKQLPAIARQLGRGVREVKETMGEADPRQHVRQALEAPEDESSAQREPPPREP